MPASPSTLHRPAFNRLTIAAAIGIFGAAWTTPTRAAPPKPVDVASCVSLEESDVSDLAIDARLVSTCERKLRCTVEWTLACESSQRSTEHSKTFTLAASGSGAARISANACKDEDWSIENLSWSCVER